MALNNLRDDVLQINGLNLQMQILAIVNCPVNLRYWNN
jgi:hypothetical protein